MTTMQQALLMKGASADRVSITAFGAYGWGTGVGDPAVASYSLQSGGDAVGTESLGDGLGGVTTYNLSPEWLLTGVNSDYESRATIITGTLSGGTTGVWQVLSTTRTWSKSRTTIGYDECTFTLEIRDAVTLTVLDTATIVLEVER